MSGLILGLFFGCIIAAGVIMLVWSLVDLAVEELKFRARRRTWRDWYQRYG